MSSAKSSNVPKYSSNIAPTMAMVRSHPRYFTSAPPGALLRDNRPTSIWFRSDSWIPNHFFATGYSFRVDRLFGGGH
jgi:hypothetical protein